MGFDRRENKLEEETLHRAFSGVEQVLELGKVCEIVRAAGGRALFVGGCVRDALLGQAPKDFDIEVYGLGARQLCDILSRHYRLDTVGASFGVIKLHGLDVDISLPRSETKVGEGHRGFDVNVMPQLSFREATARRDLTINAIMYDCLSCEVIDPWNGIGDLKAKTLRHVSQHFIEDPLRVLRVMQFAARLDFDVIHETVEICSSMTPEDLPRERLGGEWEKLLVKGIRPSRGLRFLKECGWIRYYPELQALMGCEQTPEWHPEGDVWEHTLKALDVAVSLRRSDFHDALAFMAAVLCHDFGKPLTSVRCDDGRIRSINHDVIGVKPAGTFLRRLWLNNDLEKLVLALVACHMRVHEVARSGSDRALRRLAVDAKRLDLLADIYECDLKASKPRSMELVERLRESIHRLDIATSAPKPFVLGRHLLAHGLKPSPAFKEILDRCYEAQLDGAFSDEQGGLAYLDNYLKEHGLV
ncbi:MAG: HD domain-containing protein [Victivallales bacterium]|nr:HD domain-containing protein [Victivallales bacterium]